MKQSSGARHYTLEQYAELTEDDRYRSELSRGLLVREPRPGALHARLALELAILLRDYVNAHDLGAVELEAGFRLSADPPIVRGPDVAFITHERLPETVPVSWWPFAPDLAIEIVSPGKSISGLHEKIFEYFETGTSEVWVVDPRTRSVTVYRSLSDISIIRAPGTVESRALLPGFELPLDSLFAH